VRDATEKSRQSAGELAGEARFQAGQLARTARDEARHRANSEVDKLTGFLNRLSDELNGMAEGSPPRDGHLQGLARDAAQASHRLAHRLDTRGFDGAMHDVSMFARRRPGAFLAAAFGVGIVLGRLTRNADIHAISDEMQHSDESGAAGSSASSQLGSRPTTSSTPAPGAMTTDPDSASLISRQRS
jgi:hypothetical protein